MQEQSPGSYRHCQSLVRGLDLLAALNRCTSGAAPISELARMTGIHRTTIKRLLETLLDEGYVQVEAESGLYRLSFRVQRLSYGFRDNIAIVDIARPFMRALSKSIVWPCSLVSLEGEAMVVRTSTRTFSPLSFHPGMPGRRMPVMPTAAGRAYLAYATDEERMTLLDLLQASTDKSTAPAKDAALVQRLIDETRARGYGYNDGSWSDEPSFGGISVPLRSEGLVVACLNVIFLLKAVKNDAVLQKMAEELQNAGAQIEASFAAHRERSF